MSGCHWNFLYLWAAKTHGRHWVNRGLDEGGGIPAVEADAGAEMSINRDVVMSESRGSDEETKREEISAHTSEAGLGSLARPHPTVPVRIVRRGSTTGRTELDAGDDDSGDESSTTASATEEDFKAEGSLTDSDSYERVRPAKRRRLTDRARPHCKYPECEKVALAKGKCIRHGGGKRRFREGCTKSPHYGGLCWAHGGKPRCNYPRCEKIVQSKGKCFLHGGGKRCSREGCTKSSQYGLCKAHGGTKSCSYPGCTKQAQLKGLCTARGGRRNGSYSGCTQVY